MKGMVFTEFLDMVEARFGLAVQDRIITAARLPNQGAYTAVGTYDHGELVRLVLALSEATDEPVPELIRSYGRHLFQRFSVAYPAFFQGVPDSFAFLRNIESYIHVEVRKLYPDAELPSFRYEQHGPDRLVMIYQSRRAFGDLAEGLIEGCIAHYGETVVLQREDLETGECNRTRFTLSRRR